MLHINSLYKLRKVSKLKNILGLVSICGITLLTGCISNDPSAPKQVVVVEDAKTQHRSTNTSYVNRQSSSTSSSPKVVHHTVNATPQSFQEQPLGTVSTAPTAGTDYRVVQGDTLFSIAFRYGQNYQTLAQENGIEPPYNIKVGQLIHIKGSASETDTATASQSGTYTVKKGDTLTSVASAHDLPPSAIVRVNNLSYPYKLVPGQKLTLEDPDAARKVEKTEQKVVPVAGASEVATNNSNASSSTSKNESTATTTEPIKVVSGKTRTAGGVVWMWPANGKVVKGFSLNENGNKGIDIAGSRGQNVMSAADGQVVYSGSALRGYGKLIIINHDNEYLSAYAHNDKLLVKEGQKVKRGQVIANMGSTDASSVQLHFEIRYKGKSVNPLGYLPK